MVRSLPYPIHAMDKLPQELINRIVCFAERYPDQEQRASAIGQSFEPDGSPSQFPRLAILNRTWKEAVETITFHRLGIKSDELESLQSIVTGNRRNYLSWISFEAVLPTYPEEAYEHKESRLDQHANNEAFTKAVSDLFTVLRSWEDNGVKNGVRLTIVGATSPTDAREVDEFEIEHGLSRDIQSARWAESYLRLVEPDNLPTLSNLQHLTIERTGVRSLAPSVALDLAVTMPELRTVDWEFSDYEAGSDAGSDQDSLDSDYDPEWEPATSPKARGEARTEFANKLSPTHFRSLHSANIVFVHCTPSDQRYTVPSIVPEGYTYDPFSSSIRAFSQCLTTLTLSAHVDPTLFWPSDENAIPPHWPHLKSFHIEFDMVAPSGEWYFTGPTPADDPHDDPVRGIVGSVDTRDFSWQDFRQHPDPETFDPFLGALAKAVAHMPVLESFMLTSEMTGQTKRLHISYHAPGQKAEWGDEGPEDEQYRRIYYACEMGVWVPESKTSEGLKRAGLQKFGGEAIERYVGSQYY
ncbi:hypothetical protein J4E93_006297 [Alternaria ventricosa]|uniref:uncharacterized protein n=1 Tax=Alternaria ventricosa TaxID=1187951 RepID=UPI0020C21ACC|nr:uncharacterized protein J4E93_006297 [Alternaria ventricosa]KAI4644396.1 hypothetical protein J4E93_006297 [Alternaria ventricosa]